MQNKPEVLEAKIEALQKDIERLEQRMSSLERKQEASAVEVARQFAENSKQMVIMETRIKSLGEKVDTSHAQQFSLLQSATQQISDISTWMRNMIEQDKETDNQLVQTGVDMQKERENHSRNMQLKFWGAVAGIGTFLGTAFTMFWNWITKQ
jgi:seryl-tRNA synthetase